MKQIRQAIGYDLYFDIIKKRGLPPTVIRGIYIASCPGYNADLIRRVGFSHPYIQLDED